MDLRELATAATSALVDRLVVAMNAEIEAATKRAHAAVEASINKVRAEADQLKTALEKARADEKALQATIEKMRAEDKPLRAALEKSRTDEKAHHAALEKARADEKTLQSAVEKLRADDKKRSVEEGALRAALQKEQERSATVSAQLKQTVASNAQAEAEYKKALAAAERAAAQKTSNEKELQEARRLLDAARTESKALVAQLEAETAERARVAASLVDAQKRLQAANAERDAIADRMQSAEATWLEQSKGVRDQVAQMGSAPLDHLRATFQRLSTTTTVDEALTALIEGLATEFARVALFNVSGNKLEGRQQTGFDFASDISKVAVPLTKGSALAEAVRSGRVQGLTADELTDSNRKLFGGTPSFVLILPVVIDEEIQAVFYADNSDRSKPQFVTPKRGVNFAEILLWHAVPLLTRLAEDEKTFEELREYSTHLISELDKVYASDVSAGHKGDKLQRRLQHNLEYARSMYAQRVESSGQVGAELFDEQLAEIIAGTKGTSFGRDLAAVANASAA
jgi:hypothetical protein